MRIASSAEAAAAATKAGLCGAISPKGFVCTRGRRHPQDRHRATAFGGEHDGHVYEVWPA